MAKGCLHSASMYGHGNVIQVLQHIYGSQCKPPLLAQISWGGGQFITVEETSGILCAWPSITVGEVV